MIDKKYKLDFMVEILKSVSDRDAYGGHCCTFNYFGFEIDSACGNYLPWTGRQETQARNNKISKIMTQILNDKANYTKYLNDDAEHYLIKVYDNVFRSLVIKYKITYSKETFAKGFPVKIKDFVTAHNTFYVVGDILNANSHNALVAVDDLTQYISTTSHFVKQLLNEAGGYSFEQLNPVIKLKEKPVNSLEL